MIQFPPVSHSETELFGEPDRLVMLSLAAHIVVIDDEESNTRLLTRMLLRAGFHSVTAINDASKLTSVLDAAPPDLIITDLHMPGCDGFAVLDMVAPLVNRERLPVLIVTGDGSREERERALIHGAKDFVTKPFDVAEVLLRVRNLLESRLLYQDLRKQNRTLLETAHGQTQELESTRIEMIERLALAAEYRDEQTSDHNLRVGRLSSRIAAAIGWSAADAELLGRAAALHDIGKIGIPDALLRKPTPLSVSELRIMETHTTIGARILGGSHIPLLQMAETVAVSHHERWDGSGYPRRLAGADIPLAGRIVAVADTFDAMTNDRFYQPARSVQHALAEIKALSGCHYDARLVDALERVIMAEPGYDPSSVAASAA